MSHIETLVLRVRRPDVQRKFYTDILGMTDFGATGVGYSEAEAKIFFIAADDPYDPKPDDLYWKIALAVPNIELACQQLAEKGIAMDAPWQFQDVGYLAHFKDPEGFTIELIDHWFKGNREDEPHDPARLGGGAHLNLITLRTGDIGPVQQKCRDLGMTPLCIQPVADYGFTLYFFAFTNDTPPSADLTAVANREWLYQRP